MLSKLSLDYAASWVQATSILEWFNGFYGLVLFTRQFIVPVHPLTGELPSWASLREILWKFEFAIILRGVISVNWTKCLINYALHSLYAQVIVVDCLDFDVH